MGISRSTQQIAAYIFGVTFVVAMLTIAIFLPQPSSFQIFVFRVVLALAAAGVAAMIPGFISVQLGSAIRAGGAIAVFAVVYFLNPAAIVVKSEPGPLPNGNPRAVAEAYLRVADTLSFDNAWALFSDAAKKAYDEAALREAFANARVPLNAIRNRKLQGVQSFTSLPGLSPAHYRVFSYVSIFSDGTPRGESVSVMSENGAWRIGGHNIQILP
ncbi:MAG: DUF4019 domain-containing protein [Rhodospirillaceae bacterium]|nr:DUF4019 domain-containing protein [Rhodospirillaceae bacterium]MBT5457177.1 DUF4019 domain-containing protein [Rhodospirillaceae bacterium]